MTVDEIVRREIGGVVLSPLCPEDVGAGYVSWLCDPVVSRFTEVRGPLDAEVVRRYVCDAIAAPDAGLWRIDHEGRHVGNIRLSGVNFRHRRAAVALIIGERGLWGRGIGSAAIALLAGHAFGALGLHKLTAGIYAANEGSRGAFGKAGFHCEAILREHAFFEGGFTDVLQMARFSEAT